MKLAIYLTFFIVLTSCKDTSTSKKNVTEQDSVFTTEQKISLKDSIIVQYNRIPTSLFNSNDGEDYSKYDEFKRLSSLLKEYENLSLNEEEKAYLGIFKAKCNLKISKYSKALNLLYEVKESPKFNTYKDLMLAILYDYKSSQDKSILLYSQLLKDLEMGSPNALDCNRYVIISVLAEKKKLNACFDRENQFVQLKNLGKDEVIRKFILSEVEL